MKKTEYESIIFDLIEKQLEREQQYMETLKKIKELFQQQSGNGTPE